MVSVDGCEFARHLTTHVDADGVRLGMKAEAVKKRRQRALRAVREAIGTSSSEAAERSE